MAGGTTWAKGLSERQGPRAPRSRTLRGMIQKVGEERVLYPPEGPDGVLMSRREALARVLWTRALKDGDLACAKFLMGCIDGRTVDGKTIDDNTADGKAAGKREPVRPEDLQAAETLLAEWWAKKGAAAG